MKKVFIDCGANKGEVINSFKKSIKNSDDYEIIAFEPNKKFNKFYTDKKITIFNEVVSTYDGEINFKIDENETGFGSTTILIKRSGRFKNIEKYKCIDISSFIKNNYKKNDIIYLKIDVEGGEYELIPHLYNKGCFEYIEKILLDIHPNSKLGIPSNEFEKKQKLLNEIINNNKSKFLINQEFEKLYFYEKNKKLFNKKMIIFDLDGVLIDACEWHKIALNQALKEISNYEIPENDHQSIFNGIPTKKKLEILNEKKIVDVKDNNIIFKKKQEYTIGLIEKYCKKDEDKILLLKELTKLGYLICCFTNSIQETAYLMLKNSEIFSYFDTIITNENVTSPKPNPEGYITICNKFDYNVKDVYIIEDSEKGKAAAYASGCNVIEVKDAKEVNLDLLKRIEI